MNWWFIIIVICYVLGILTQIIEVLLHEISIKDALYHIIGSIVSLVIFIMAIKTGF